MHLSEITFKLYAFVYNYSTVEPQQGGLIVALLKTPLLADPVDKYAKCPGRNTLLSCCTNCIIGYDMSVKLARKPLNMVEIVNPTIH